MNPRGTTSVARWFIFKPKHPNLGKFWRASELKILVNFMAIAIFYSHFVYFTAIR
jgi:hypothetical protein